ILAKGLEILGYQVKTETFFDTIRVDLGKKSAAQIVKLAESQGINLRIISSTTVGISLDETTAENDLMDLFHVFNSGQAPSFTVRGLAEQVEVQYLAPCARTSGYL